MIVERVQVVVDALIESMIAAAAQVAGDGDVALRWTEELCSVTTSPSPGESTIPIHIPQGNNPSYW